VCGRFTLTLPPDLIAEAFGLDPDDLPPLEPRYNIAPTQPIAVVRRLRPGAPRQLDLLRWGVSPATAPGGARARGGPLINARSESAATRPGFRDAFRRRRCLVPADGFYEWAAGPGRRQAFHVTRKDGRPLALAGLWEPAPADGAPASCVILTTEPNDLLRPIHERMPVIVEPADFDRWLDPERAGTDVGAGILRPLAAEALAARPVGPAVNNAQNEGAACLEPAT
jgi:putative SOS response-associated peptidase YedK